MNTSSLLKNGISYITAKRYEFIHAAQAKKSLRLIEQTKGRTDPKLFKMCRDYSIDVFGNSKYAPWLKVYTAFNRNFKEGWIPDNYYRTIVIPKIQGDFGKISNLKFFTNTFFNTQNFPDLVYHINGKWLTVEGEILPIEKVARYLFNSNTKVLFKQDNSMQGLGIQVFEKETINLTTLMGLGNGVFQYFIEQHPFFSEYVEDSVATLRITTTVNSLGKPKVNDAYLRFGMKGESFVAAGSQLKVSVNSIGELSDLGYLNGWQAVKEHPNSKLDFGGKTVPTFNKATDLCMQLHRSYPQIDCIGWDVGIDKNNEVKILEWNGYHNDIKFSEATNGPCFIEQGWEKLWKA